jgi:hypothetical protein
VTVPAGDAMDDPLESQAAEIVGHLRGGIRVPQQGFDLRVELAVTRASSRRSISMTTTAP